MDHRADTNWLIRFEREVRANQLGPAHLLAAKQRVYITPIAFCEFLSAGITRQRLALLKGFTKLPAPDYVEATLAARLRLQRAKQGKSLSTPDALMAASALHYGMRLITADKDFSGIPGLKWSSYPQLKDASPRL